MVWLDWVTLQTQLTAVGRHTPQDTARLPQFHSYPHAWACMQMEMGTCMMCVCAVWISPSPLSEQNQMLYKARGSLRPSKSVFVHIQGKLPELGLLHVPFCTAPCRMEPQVRAGIPSSAGCECDTCTQRYRWEGNWIVQCAHSRITVTTVTWWLV